MIKTRKAKIEKTDIWNKRSKRSVNVWNAEGISESEEECGSYEVKLCVTFIRLNDSYDLKSSLVTVWDMCDGLKSCEDGYDESTDAAKWLTARYTWSGHWLLRTRRTHGWTQG